MSDGGFHKVRPNIIFREVGDEIFVPLSGRKNMSDIKIDVPEHPSRLFGGVVPDSWWTAPHLQVSRDAFYAAARAHCFVADEKDRIVYAYLSEESPVHRQRGVAARVRAGYPTKDVA